MWEGVPGGGEGDAEDDEENVGPGQVQDQQVCRVPHLLVPGHHQHHQEVAEEAHQHHNGEEDGHHDGDDLLHGLLEGHHVGRVLLLRRHVELGRRRVRRQLKKRAELQCKF